MQATGPGAPAGRPSSYTELDSLLQELLIPKTNDLHGAAGDAPADPGADPAAALLHQLRTALDTAGDQEGEGALAYSEASTKAAAASAAPAVRSACRELLWAAGVRHFEGRRLAQAGPFLRASLLYNGSADQALAAHQALVLCALASQHLDE